MTPDEMRATARVLESIADLPGRVDVTVHPRTGKVDVHTHADEDGDSEPMPMIPTAWLRNALRNATESQEDYVRGGWGAYQEGWNACARALGKWLDKQVKP